MIDDEKIVDLGNLWLINGNRFTKEFCKGDLDTAKKYAETLIDCFDCVDCMNCVNCNHCAGCDSCKDCEHCSFCASCKECSHCRNCNHCDKCAYCTLCNDCAECNRCENCSFYYRYTNYSAIYSNQPINTNMQSQQLAVPDFYNNSVIPEGFYDRAAIKNDGVRSAFQPIESSNK